MAVRLARAPHSLPSLLLTGAIVLLVAGCSRTVEWTDEERNNAQHVFAALKAYRDSVQFENASGTTVSQGELRKAKLHLQEVIEEAELVTDSVLVKLDNINPGIHARWKGQFIAGLRLRLGNLEASNGNVKAEWLGSAMLDRFSDWSISLRDGIRVPKIKA